MKFLCDNCKAKYQIADDKVAGKTVRMKCRKCGHQIEVRAAVTETSVAGAPPKAPEAPRPGVKPGLATSLSAQKPRTASAAPNSGALAGAFQRTVEHGGAAGAPHHRSEDVDISVSVTDEWYVAINGVPVGPVRISELRRKAAGGAVTEDSLCWQEGLEEWRPVRSIPELAALVREAAQQNRVSLVNPQETRPSSPPPPPQRAPAAPPQKPAPPAPLQTRTEPPPPRLAPPPPHHRSNVVPLHARISSPDDHHGSGTAPLTAPMGMGGSGGGGMALAVAQSPRPSGDLFPAPQTPFPMGDPFAAPPPPAPASPAFSMSSSPSIVPGFAPLAEPQVLPPPEQKKGVPLWFWPVLVLALAFGGGAAFFVFKQPPPQQIVVQVPVPQATTAAPPPAESVVELPVTPPAETSAAPVPTGGGKAGSGGKVATAPTTPKGGGAADLTGLLGGGGAGGPNVGPNGTPGGGSGGGLDQAGVERVVASHRVGVRRTCWERGSNDQKSSVNVTVNATVGPGGDVVSASSTGDDPVVAKCIEGQVRSWRFPAPGTNTQIAIPFKFVRQ